MIGYRIVMGLTFAWFTFYIAVTIANFAGWL